VLCVHCVSCALGVFCVFCRFGIPTIGSCFGKGGTGGETDFRLVRKIERLAEASETLLRSVDAVLGLVGDDGRCRDEEKIDKEDEREAEGDGNGDVVVDVDSCSCFVSLRPSVSDRFAALTVAFMNSDANLRDRGDS